LIEIRRRRGGVHRSRVRNCWTCRKTSY